MSVLHSLNVAHETVPVHFAKLPTGIGKRPTAEAVDVREPGPRKGGLGSGLVGDTIGNHRHHGGTDQAVYAFAREVLDDWQRRLVRPIADGEFGENLTTVGIDVDNALVGERWQVGSDVILQVTVPRVPCATFRGAMGERGWVRRFTDDARPGAYLRVVAGGSIRVGDPIEVVHRPAHDVTIAMVFRALLREADLLPGLLVAGADLPDQVRAKVEAREGPRLRVDTRR